MICLHLSLLCVWSLGGIVVGGSLSRHVLGHVSGYVDKQLHLIAVLLCKRISDGIMQRLLLVSMLSQRQSKSPKVLGRCGRAHRLPWPTSTVLAPERSLSISFITGARMLQPQVDKPIELRQTRRLPDVIPSQGPGPEFGRSWYFACLFKTVNGVVDRTYLQRQGYDRIIRHHGQRPFGWLPCRECGVLMVEIPARWSEKEMIWIASCQKVVSRVAWATRIHQEVAFRFRNRRHALHLPLQSKHKTHCS